MKSERGTHRLHLRLVDSVASKNTTINSSTSTGVQRHELSDSEAERTTHWINWEHNFEDIT